jgi:hypothetical protein
MLVLLVALFYIILQYGPNLNKWLSMGKNIKIKANLLDNRKIRISYHLGNKR